eukprot:scaffold3547_cov142-Pinguiococcus_pyrenoidosus.AAC.1
MHQRLVHTFLPFPTVFLPSRAMQSVNYTQARGVPHGPWGQQTLDVCQCRWEDQRDAGCSAPATARENPGNWDAESCERCRPWDFGARTSTVVASIVVH